MNEKKYSIKNLITECEHQHEDDEYEFKITYDAKSEQITTKIKMQADILAIGIAFILAETIVGQKETEIYLDDIKLKIRELRKNNAVDK